MLFDFFDTHTLHFLVLMHNAEVMEHFLRDENIIRFVAVFEYDPAFPSIKASYSAFLKEKASFKEASEGKRLAMKHCCSPLLDCTHFRLFQSTMQT